MSSSGEYDNSLSAVTASAPTVSTSCCKTAFVQVANSNVRQGASLANFMKLTLDFAPSSSLVVSLSTSGPAGSASDLIFPPTMTFTSQSALSASFSFVGSSVAGNFSIELAVSGASASEFQAVFSSSSSQKIVVYAVYDQPPVPVLQSVQFSDDVLVLSVVFSSTTDKA